MRARLFGAHDHEVDLRPAAAEPHGRLVAALADDPLDRRQLREGLDDALGVVGFGQQIEVADRLAPPSE